jgi:hypothetical protein
MDKKNIWKKIPAIAIIGFLIALNATSSAGIIDNNVNINAEEKQSVLQSQTLNDPSYFLYGTKIGDWFISCVTIHFNWNPNLCKEVWLNIEQGGWQQYTSPVETCEDGKVTVSWYWVDLDDNKHYSAFQIKIDKTPPTITIDKEILSDTVIKFTANVNDGDEGSGIDYVEFWEDDEFKFDIDVEEGDFFWDWEGSGIHIIKAIVYDNVSHSASAEEDTERKGRSYLFKVLSISKPLQDLLNILIWSQKILLNLL